MELQESTIGGRKILAEALVAPLKIKIMSDGEKEGGRETEEYLMHHIDRLLVRWLSDYSGG
jgi:hypothetical protein